ncbi:MAG TPA: hypothetical protein VFW51_02095, partial [Actinomycetota bacterium]|nr:hypothetical protein [Actinomycetota bacterium]
KDEEPVVVKLGDAEPEVAEPEVAEPEVAEPEVAEPEVAEPEVAEPEVAAEPDEVAAVEGPGGAAVPSTLSESVEMPTARTSAAEPGSALPASEMPAPPKPWADRASAASTAAPWEAITARRSESSSWTTEGVVDEPMVTESDDASAEARDVEVEPPATTDVIDLTTPDQISIDDLDEDEADEDAGADPGSTTGGGWAAPNEKIWQLLRGRRRD